MTRPVLNGRALPGRGTDIETTTIVSRVSKNYGPVCALDGVSLEVRLGEVVGLVGRNGAGKTTLMSLLAGVLKADEGSIRLGEAFAPDGDTEPIGYASQDVGLYAPLTVLQNLRYFGRINGLRNRKMLADRIDAVASALHLGELLDRPVYALSGGEKRRSHAAAALVHGPRLVLLDEPTAGADVLTRQSLLEHVRHAAQNDGCAVVYSTHYLPEIEELDARVVMLEHGRVVSEGQSSDIVAKYGSPSVVFTFRRRVPRLRLGYPTRADENRLRVYTSEPVKALKVVLATVNERRYPIDDIAIEQPSVESVLFATDDEQSATEPRLVSARRSE